MKLGRRTLVAAVVMSVLFSLSAFGGNGSENVLQLVVNMSGVVQDYNGMTPVAVKVKVTANGLINLARGRAPNAPTPPNEVLALASQCNGAMRLIVFDKNTSSSLATIAVAGLSSAVESSKSIQFVTAMEVQSVGGVDNSLNDGTLMLAGTLTVDSNGCLLKANATVVGIVDVTFTDDVGTKSGDVLIPKGKMVTGASLGVLAP